MYLLISWVSGGGMCTVGRCDTVPVKLCTVCVVHAPPQPVKMYLGTCSKKVLCVFKWHVCMNIKVPLPGHVL
jgi:hypothetical protein